MVNFVMLSTLIMMVKSWFASPTFLMTVSHLFDRLEIVWLNRRIIGFQEGPQYKRTIELQFSVGAEAADFKKMANAEKLDPLELELRKLETVVKEIVDEMNYLKRREAKLRDTNGNDTLTDYFIDMNWSSNFIRIN